MDNSRKYSFKDKKLTNEWVGRYYEIRCLNALRFPLEVKG